MKSFIYFFIVALLLTVFSSNYVKAQYGYGGSPTRTPEMRELMLKYVWHDSLFHFDLIKTEALKKGVSAEAYDRFVSEMEVVNDIIKELLAKGEPVNFIDEGEIHYYGPDSVVFVLREKK